MTAERKQALSDDTSPATPEELEVAREHLKLGFNLTTRQFAVLIAPEPMTVVRSRRSIMRQLKQLGVSPCIRAARGREARWPVTALDALLGHSTQEAAR